MTIPGAAISVPSPTSLALEACDEAFGGRLALAVADLGATVLLQGLDIDALDKLQRTITERWCRAAIAGAETCGDAAIGISESIDAAIARMGKASNHTPAIEVLLVRTDGSGDRAELDARIANLGPDRRVHAVILPVAADPASTDFAALARICWLLASDDAKALPNQVITLHTCTAAQGYTRPVYPEMTICAPTIAPAF
jgi:hypothetical protein